ncbi:LLM class F420-dependent oxidoreductase [Mycobacterium syngnathidarum]|uniref:LLM class F420-dependent oxidoreductase n=1 Tax=Mycobacterium syngnathidarum TaxID=1908205 RepID=A0A1S1JFD5_9MYCO|nr:LLM class F420-dependent oxidoreductase [Mycobacterium syngnathidarum]OHT82561.1 LLM class F420-dependent oxidoreductase [Mycobacterium syngnathidarum]OLT97843.1 LLM class F420-dependent oxidoreductase [Mycobacterium syngnathidarum]
MRLGLSTPVVVQVPGVASPWETEAGIADLARISASADDLGFDYLTCSEHVAVPAQDAAVRGAVYWDPLATLGFLAAHTRRIRLATSVLVLGYHHPLEIAKRYGTLDRVSAGRLVLGVGIGSLKAEFELIDARWWQRAERADDALRALRASLSSATPSYHGPFYDYEDMTVLPHAEQQQVPIWVGGRSAGSLRRAVKLADGWMPFGLSPESVRDLLDDVDLPTEFDVLLSATVDPEADRVGTRKRLATLRDAGATAVTCAVRADSVDHYCEQLARLRDIEEQ